MLKLIGGLVLLAVVIILILASTKPSDFRVERSITIDAPPQKVAALINDFHNWTAWSPWANMDPAMKTTYSGPASGPGAIYEWEGNSKVGKGRMEILSANPARISVKLDFLKPFEGHNTADFLLQPEGTGTRVTWVMYGPMKFFPGKIMSVFTSMDNIIGADFEKGLASIKLLAEKQP
jgi:Polyketide cyclase / dehydrase and lipid transport